MALDRPTQSELIEAVREFLETKVMQETTGPLQFNTRIAVNVLKILERELETGQDITSGAIQRIQQLLSSDESDPAVLNTALSEAIENGDLAWNNPELLHHLRTTTMDKLSVDNPRYSAYLEEIEAKQD